MPKFNPENKTNEQVQTKKGPGDKTTRLKSPQGGDSSAQRSPLLFNEIPPTEQIFAFVDPEKIRAKLNNLSVAQIEELLVSALGKGPHAALAEWAEYRLKLLDDYNITEDFKRVEDLRIRKETLAILLMAINLSPGLDYGFGKLFGDKRTRQKHAAALLAPIPTLTILLDSMGNLAKDFKQTSLASPARAISDLKFLSSFFVMGDKIYEFLGVNSLLELSKFGLASLVHASGGNYLDREVSALTGAALQKPDYDETGHRVWRIRNFPRLQRSVPFLTKVCIAFNNVLSKQ